ncbi:MAG: lipoyl synthase [bacterium]
MTPAPSDASDATDAIDARTASRGAGARDAAAPLVQRRRSPLPAGPRPPWLKIRLTTDDAYRQVQSLVKGNRLHTVCEEARCPNIFECWGNRTATFMVLGDICTRHCGFCSVGKGAPGAVDRDEPANLAAAVRALDLRHTVITMVNRDDLPDGGASHLIEVIRATRRENPECRVELLISDLDGNWNALDRLIDEAPDVLAHNTETVPRLYRRVRQHSNYPRTLELIARIRARRASAIPMTKSGVMLGLGETRDELLTVFADLARSGCEILTIGQYLPPAAKALPLERYWTPEEFAELRERALELGFTHVESGPLVRSSYHAHAHTPSSWRGATPGVTNLEASASAAGSRAAASP